MNMRKALQVNHDGTLAEIDLDKGGDGVFSVLRALQRAVKGNVECFDVSDQTTMWSNEEGKYQAGLEYNPYATAMWREAFGMSRHQPDADFIMGPVVLTGTPDDEGETRGITVPQRARLKSLVALYAEDLPASPLPIL